jgi:hypothetical protein
VLTTNTGLDPRTTALAYEHPWMVESLFRSMKSVLETRPVCHKCDETIRGHVFCSFLALVLRKELEDRSAARNWKLEWHDVVQDLDRLEELTLTVDEKGYVLRTDPKSTVAKVFQAAGVALPPVIRPVVESLATASSLPRKRDTTRFLDLQVTHRAGLSDPQCRRSA